MAMSPRLLRPLASGFDPRRIANLTGWYDATDSASYTESSGQITEWRDKSGRGNHVNQTTANNRPTLFESSGDVQGATQAAINGRQALYFDGVNDNFVTTATVTSGQGRTVFAVARRSNSTSVHTVACFGQTTAGNAARWVLRYGVAATPRIGGDSVATNQDLSGGILAWTDPHVSCWSQNSGTRNLSYFLDGISYAITGNPPNTQTSFGGLRIGAGAFVLSIDQFFQGLIGELIVYDSELSASQRDRVTQYLTGKWGVV